MRVVYFFIITFIVIIFLSYLASQRKLKEKIFYLTGGYRFKGYIDDLCVISPKKGFFITEGLWEFLGNIGKIRPEPGNFIIEINKTHLVIGNKTGEPTMKAISIQELPYEEIELRVEKQQEYIIFDGTRDEVINLVTDCIN